MSKTKIFLSLALAFTVSANLLVSCGKDKTGTSSNSIDSSSVSHVHSYGEGWEFNADRHWHTCECGEKNNYAKHKGGEATCVTQAKCEVCGTEYGTTSTHTFGARTELDGGIEGYACVCGERVPLLSVQGEDGSFIEGVIDFLVEVEEDREPVVLQLSDPQLADFTNIENKCYKYIRETVEATNPDLILVTGDLVYGKFDNVNGDLFTDYVNFMESLRTPWAPVFGNHDNECPKGVNWQCKQLENAEYCLFEQRELTGNGNYTVGVSQNGNLLRVFYMMDSNGCDEPSEADKDRVTVSAGFGDDQIEWFESSIATLKSFEPDVKISFAYHIQQAYFEQAYYQYGYDGRASGSQLLNPINLDKKEGVKEGDFGYLGRKMKGAWDWNYSVFNKMKELGVDSIFVGHEHCNSISVVYEGVRFQYGQKSSMYDRYNAVNASGEIIGDHNPVGLPLMGGTAFSLSKEDGAIVSPYIYLCGDPLGNNPKRGN